MQKEGQPDRIFLSPPFVDAEESDAIHHVLKGGWIAPVGPQLDFFESNLENAYPKKKVLALNSGTSALHLALILAGIEDGDEVVIGSFTFASCANVVMYERAIPVFLDSEEETWNLNPGLLEEYLKKADKKPRAVIVTHLFGIPAQIKRISTTCKEHGVYLIEDAAEALGSRYEDKHVGLFGDFAALSFNGNKIITTGGGGALVVDEDGYSRAKYLATQANNGKSDYNHEEVGFNYRMSNVLAGIGIAQLEKLDYYIKRKREIFEYYKSRLGEWFDFPKEKEGSFCNRWLTTPILKGQLDPDKLIMNLENENIESRRFWKPLHLHGAYNQAPYHGSNVSETIYSKGVCLPSGVGLTMEDQDRIIEVLIRELS